MHIYSDEFMVIGTAPSRDPALLKIDIKRPYPAGPLAVKGLIESTFDANGNLANSKVYAGSHPGMPQNQVWFFSPEGEQASDYLDEVAENVRNMVAVVDLSS